jgi:hypothetical protein
MYCGFKRFLPESYPEVVGAFIRIGRRCKTCEKVAFPQGYSHLWITASREMRTAMSVAHTADSTVRGVLHATNDLARRFFTRILHADV